MDLYCRISWENTDKCLQEKCSIWSSCGGWHAKPQEEAKKYYQYKGNKT